MLNEENAPIDYAQIIGINADSALVATSYSDSLGVFRIYADEVAFVHISALGYNTSVLPVGAEKDLGRVVMAASDIVLPEVEVRRTAPIAKLEGNSLVVSVEGTNLSNLGTAQDVLGCVPLVRRDGDGYKVFGKGTPVIYVNGRQVRNLSELEQISSENIKDISVITNPGAEYASGVKSVIIIKTTRPQGEGVGIRARVVERFSDYNGSTAQVDFNYRRGGFDLGLMGFASDDRTKHQTDFTQSNYLNTVVCDSLNQTAKNRTTTCIGQVVLSWQMSENHSVGGYFQCKNEREDIDFRNGSRQYNDATLIDNVNTRGSSDKDFYPVYSSNVYYSGNVKGLGIDFNADYYAYKPWINNNQTHIASDGTSADLQYESGSDARMFAQKLVAQYNVGKFSLTAGEEFTDSELSMESLGTTGIYANSENTVNENSFAVFAKCATMIGESVQAEAGLRYENVEYEYASLTGADTKRNTYNNLFPTLSLSARLSQMSMSLSYSNKRVRPSYAQLDGNMYYVNRYQCKSGNPYLKPTNVESLDLMLMRQLLFLQVSYQRMKNPVLNVASKLDGHDNVNLLSFVNGRTMRTVNAMLGTQIDLPTLMVEASAGVMKQFFSSDFRGEQKKFSKPIGIVSCYVSALTLFNTWVIADYSLQTKGNMQNVFMDTKSVLNLKLYRDFCGGKFTAILTGHDIFDEQTDKIKMYSGNMFINTMERHNSRAFSVTLRYRVNMPSGRYKGDGAGESEKSRME